MKWLALLAVPLTLAGVISASVVARNEKNVKRTVTMVTVGGSDGELTYTPASVTGLVAGDTIEFTLASGSGTHTITQAQDENDPCVAASGGVDYTFDPSDSSTWTFNWTVSSSDPTYAFCAIEGHCDAGMKFTINV